jgi:hypothetical protein
LLKETKGLIKEEFFRVFKVRLMRGLREYYRLKGLKKERKKCGYTL